MTTIQGRWEDNMTHARTITIRAVLGAMLGIACLAPVPTMAWDQNPQGKCVDPRGCGSSSSPAPGGGYSAPSYDYEAARRAQEAAAAERRRLQDEADRLEREVELLNEDLAPLTSFVLPGGSKASAHLHLARAIARRAERAIVALSEAEAISLETVKYANRLSDLLFVAARWANDKGAADVLWKPGANR